MTSMETPSVGFVRPIATHRVIALAGLFLFISVAAASREHTHKTQSSDASLVVHEWGTFTSIAGADGDAMQWLPLQGKSDLPSFVERNSNATVKGDLCGTIRMETPVVYFYSPHETTVSVHVSFAQGLLTEWYPHVTSVGPANPTYLVALDSRTRGAISWNSVTITPGLDPVFRREAAASHYYAARATSASPISISAPSGEQHEKFLFYRGVAGFAPPVSAKVQGASQLQLRNRATQSIPALILFERRGQRIGYRLISPLANSGTIAVETPSTSGTLDSLRTDFEDLLVAQGLFPDEAQAMLETWRDSWFEEGSRLFYIVPRPFVDSVLPLSIQPASGQLVRAFVGRIELVTPATEEDVTAALLNRDNETLKRYGRFLPAIVQVMLSRRADPADANRLRQALSEYYAWSFPPTSRPPQ